MINRNFWLRRPDTASVARSKLSYLTIERKYCPFMAWIECDHVTVLSQSDCSKWWLCLLTTMDYFVSEFITLAKMTDLHGEKLFFYPKMTNGFTHPYHLGESQFSGGSVVILNFYSIFP